MICGRLFLSNGILVDEDINQILQQVINLSLVYEAIIEHRNKISPSPEDSNVIRNENLLNQGNK